MLPAVCRMRRRAEFAATIRAGRRARRGVLVVHAVPGTAGAGTGDQQVHRPVRVDPATAVARVGFVVPRAVGSAVRRNLVRRRLRHFVFERLDMLPPGTSLVIRVLPGAAEVTADQLRTDLVLALAAVMSPSSRSARRADGARSRASGGAGVAGTDPVGGVGPR